MGVHLLNMTNIKNWQEVLIASMKIFKLVRIQKSTAGRLSPDSVLLIRDQKEIDMIEIHFLIKTVNFGADNLNLRVGLTWFAQKYVTTMALKPL